MNKMLSGAVVAAVAVSFAAEAGATEWNVSVWGKRRAFTEHIEKLAELVSEKTGGSFTMNISYGGLSKNTENLDGISIGAFEMAQFCAGYHADKNPSITVLELPFLGVSTLEEEWKVSQAVYEHPATAADLARWNATLLMPSPLPQYNIAGVGEPPRTLKDFDGLTVRATGGIGEALSLIGAVPTSVTSEEARQALDSGIVKSIAFAPHAHMSFGVMEVAKWWSDNLNPGTVNCPVVVNTDALNALSDAERDALLGSVDEAMEYYIDFYENQTMKKWWPLLEEKGVERISYNEERLAEFREKAAGPVAAKWIEDNTARGLPAQELYDLVISTLGR
ncbi:TRAP transporter substrate-binding protein DctP [Ruegeria marina]|uniref:TRAP-type C4-dicarboxylate transport system, substrate-binding protein n=1 Tax=Ruegeria marina TaxID=639004 RepID=A0A1G6QQ32_9RHOB|nr:TRAP transporter substrate-binding protein DctP [Ruegeria marina]SDC94448.1 TRAP-type C4-dicarboxylate transport system, substrate-binding protein [Ruegeria marina]